MTDRPETDQADTPAAPLLVLLFPFNVWSLQPEHRPLLAGFATDTWPDLKKRSLTVVGFTDDTGPQRYNDRLARRRADSVAKALRELGIEGLRTIAKGKCCYLSDNDSLQGRANNRRVEIHLSFHSDNTRSRSNEH